MILSATSGVNGRVYESTISKRGILGYFLDRGEAEVVVNTRMLGEITEVSRRAPIRVAGTRACEGA
jgi:hypothetical protein